jgi:hypothetical protein
MERSCQSSLHSLLPSLPAPFPGTRPSERPFTEGLGVPRKPRRPRPREREPPRPRVSSTSPSPTRLTRLGPPPKPGASSARASLMSRARPSSTPTLSAGGVRRASTRPTKTTTSSSLVRLRPFTARARAALVVGMQGRTDTRFPAFPLSQRRSGLSIPCGPAGETRYVSWSNSPPVDAALLTSPRALSCLPTCLPRSQRGVPICAYLLALVWLREFALV